MELWFRFIPCLFYLYSLDLCLRVVIVPICYELKQNYILQRQSRLFFSVCLLKSSPENSIFDHTSIKNKCIFAWRFFMFFNTHSLVSIYKCHGLQTEILPQRQTWLNLYASLTGKKQVFRTDSLLSLEKKLLWKVNQCSQSLRNLEVLSLEVTIWLA